MTIHEINKPSQVTYWIGYDDVDGPYVWGQTQTNQLTTCPLTTLEQFTVEQEYLDRGDELGIDVSVIV